MGGKANAISESLAMLQSLGNIFSLKELSNTPEGRAKTEETNTPLKQRIKITAPRVHKSQWRKMNFASSNPFEALYDAEKDEEDDPEPAATDEVPPTVTVPATETVDAGAAAAITRNPAA